MAKDNRDFFKTKNSWSEIKDRLLGCYLKPYFQKVLRTGRPIFYVDCFAGKGKFDDGQDGSHRIALKVRKESINKTFARNAQIDTCFIDPNYADELRNNIANYCYANSEPKVISGKYEEVIVNLLSTERNKNIFLYIDPYGIKALDYQLFEKFSDTKFNSIEILINMNSFGFIRAGCCVLNVDCTNDEALNSLEDLKEYEPTQVDRSLESIELLNSIAGGDYWQDIIKDKQAGKIDGYFAEKQFSTEYKKRLRQKYAYVLDMPICLKPRQLPKYRMIHVTNHAIGCILMADNMSSRSDELFVEIQNPLQPRLFPHNVQSEIIDEPSIRNDMKEFLSGATREMAADELIASFFTQYGVLCKSGTIREIWKNMEQAGEIEIIRKPATTPNGRPSTFFSEDRKKRQSLTIRSRKP
jgi:three-Cys-motif partner protein